MLFEIGKIREMQKQYPNSLDCYKESLILRQSVNAEDEKTADIIFRMGEVYRVCGKLDLAYNNLTVALGAYYMSVGKNHPSVATTLHSLGYICGQLILKCSIFSLISPAMITHTYQFRTCIVAL